MSSILVLPQGEHDGAPNDGHRLVISLLESRTDTAPNAVDLSWCDFWRSLQSVRENKDGLPLAAYLTANHDERSRQKDGPAWTPAKFSMGTRNREGVEQVSCLVLDIDHCASFEPIEKALAEYEYVLHTTYSHSPEKPKCRVILPLVRPVSAAALVGLFDRMNTLVGDVADRACGHDPSRLFYLPACPGDAKEHYVARRNCGRLLDPRALPAEKPAITTTSTPRASMSATATPPSTPLDFTKGYGDGDRTAQLTTRAGWCYAKGMDLGKTITKCLEWNQHNLPPLNLQKVVDTCTSIYKTHIASIEAEEAKTLDELSALNTDYAWVRKQARIFRFKHQDFLSSSDFRSDFANRHVYLEIKGKQKLMSLGEAWLKWSGRRQHEDVVYVPGVAGLVDDCVNLWSGWGCQPKSGNIAPWNELLSFLFDGHPDKRKWFEQWLAYPIQHPGAKLATAVLLWSTRQGVGKTLVGETISKLYGAANACTISAAELHGSFNGWAKGRQFVLGEENASSDHRADANKLKHLITGDTIGVNEKFQPEVFLKNTMNFLFTSNDPKAFHLETHDRRFFIWEIVGAPLAPSFYEKYVRWVDGEGGKEALMDYLLHVDLTGFEPKAPAPMTESKAEMQELSRSDLERWLADLQDPDHAYRYLGKEIVTTEELVDAYGSLGRGRTNTTAVGTALRRVGVNVGRRVSSRRGRVRVVAICRADHWREKDNDEWAKENDRARAGLASALAAVHIATHATSPPS